MIKEFIEKLRQELTYKNYHDVDGIINYFEEIINDRLDSGEKEDDILNSLESVETIVSSLTKEISLSDYLDQTKDFKEVHEIEESENTYVFNHIDDIDIDVANPNLEIYTSDRGDILVKIIGKYASKFNVYEDNGELKISQKDAIFTLGSLFFKVRKDNIEEKVNIIIELPHKDYDELNIENVSGNIHLMDLSFNEGQIETVSGNINLVNCHFDELSLESVSGNIESNSLIVEEELNTGSVSGLINLNYVMATSIELESVSGDINILIEGQENDYSIDIEKILDEQHLNKHADKSLSIETISGNIEYNFK